MNSKIEANKLLISKLGQNIKMNEPKHTLLIWLLLLELQKQPIVKHIDFSICKLLHISKYKLHKIVEHLQLTKDFIDGFIVYEAYKGYTLTKNEKVIKTYLEEKKDIRKQLIIKLRADSYLRRNNGK